MRRVRRGFRFRAHLVGGYHWIAEPLQQWPMALDLAACARRLDRWLCDRTFDIIGAIDAPGLADRCALHGSLRSGGSYRQPLELRLAFVGNDGGEYQLQGVTHLRWRELMWSMSRVLGTIGPPSSERRAVAADPAIAGVELRFDLRHGWAEWARSWSWCG